MAKTDANYNTHHKTNVLMKLYIVHCIPLKTNVLMKLYIAFFLNTPHIIVSVCQ